VPSIRVILVGLPQLLADIVEELIAGQPDIEFVGSVAAYRDLRRVIRRAQPDVILCRASGSTLPAGYGEILEAHPHVRLLAIEARDGTGFAYDLRPVRAPLDVWPEGLIDAIRSAWTRERPFSWDDR
jgi:DNA-binding NarL/FixJ family response regulator